MKRFLLFTFFIASSILGYGQVTIYSEDFTGQNDKGVIGVSSSSSPIVDLSGVTWSIDITNSDLSATTDWFAVKNELFEARDVDGMSIWLSPSISIGPYTNVQFSIDASESGTLEASDIINTEYRIDGGSWQIASTNGSLNDDFSTAIISQTGLTGNTIELRVTMNNNSGSEYLRIDNILVEGFVSTPTITTTVNSVSGLDYFLGNGPSSNQSFSISTNGFNSGGSDQLTVTAPSFFEVSTDPNSGFFTVLSVPAVIPGITSPTTVYARLGSGHPVGVYNGNLVVSGPGATDAIVALQGEVLTPEVNFAVASANYNENDGASTFQVTSSSMGNFSVDVTAIGGSAVNGNEYTYATQTVNFTAGIASLVPFTIHDNGSCDGNTDIIFQLSNPVNCTLGSTSQSTITILDDEMTSGTIVIQDFDATAPVWNIASGAGTDDNAYGYVFQGRRIGGSQSFDLAPVTVSGGTGTKITIRTAAGGIENNDNLAFYVNLDGAGFPAQADIILKEGSGDNNNSWTYSATGIASVIAGTGSTTFNGDGPTGYAMVELIIPDGTNTVALRIESNNSNSTEYYYIDDITLNSTICNTCAEPTVNSVFWNGTGSPQFLTSTSATLNWTVAGNGENNLLLMSENGVGSEPMDNNTYLANSTFGTTGTSIGSNDFVVYNGAANTVNVTGLTPGTEYTAEVYEYNCLPGTENYLVSSYGADIFTTKPEPAENFTNLCITDNTIELSWNAPLVGSFDGYVVVAREVNNPSLAIPDPATATFNTDFSLAPIYQAATTSKILYIGNSNNVTFTGFTEGVTYTFNLYTYALASNGEYRFSDTYRIKTAEIDQMDVEGNVTGFAGDTEATITWVNPPTQCWDEIMVIATTPYQVGINNTPTGNGSAYTANSNYLANNQVVYKGTGSSVLVTNLTNFTGYGFEVFIRKGSEWSHGKEIFLVPTTATILEPGDLAIVAMNTRYNNNNESEFCFVSFKNINESTSIDFTDNGYERQNVDQWGGTEGIIRMQRTGGGAIAAGETICVRGNGNQQEDFEIYRCGVLDPNWTISDLNGGGFYVFNPNVDDQLWIMQGGSWVGGNGIHNAVYTGNVLYGWTAVGWEPSPGYNDPKGSTLYPSSQCFTTNLDGVASHDKVKYTGPTNNVSQFEWINRINDVTNWTGYTDNTAYNASSEPDYAGSCINFGVVNSFTPEGLWTGAKDDQWFDCLNWSNLKVPNDSTNVTIPSPAVSANDAVIDMNHPDADLYGSLAKSRYLVVEGKLSLQGSSDMLVVNKELTMQSSTALLENKLGGTVEVFGPFESLNSSCIIDFSSTSPSIMSTFIIHHNWIINGNTNINYGFIENNSQVIFRGGNLQQIENDGGLETFHNLVIDKESNTKVELSVSDIKITNVLDFQSSGYIDSHSDDLTVIVDNNATNAIIGYEPINSTGTYTVNDNYVNGRLERNVMPGLTYDYPIGDRPSGKSYHPVTVQVTNGISGNVQAEFLDEDPGYMDLFDNTQTCGGNPRILDYDLFSNEGYWKLSGPPSMTYNLTVHPNDTTNLPLNPVVGGEEYRLLRTASANAGSQWPNAAAYESDICNSFTSYYAAQGEFTGFSIFSIVADALDPAILPIELLDFSAKNEDKDIAITWTTATEINNDIFRLYHSLDGEHWEIIDVQDGAGNSTETLHYSYVHKQPNFGLHYYQLEQVDYDGAHSYSAIEVAEIGNKEDLIVYPIPASEYLFIDAPSDIDTRSIHVYSDQGQMLNNWSYNQGKMYIGDLTDGVYFLSITSKENNVVKKFIKVSGR